MMQRAKILSSFLLFVVLQACTGGSACSGCGVEPIPGGFPLDHRVTRALQARLTPNAFTFLEENAATLVSTLVTGGLSFAIPETTTNVAVVGDVTICPGGGCTATATVTALDLQSTPPSSIVAVARLEVVTTNIRINMASNWMCLFLEAPQCDVDLDTRRTDPTYNTIRATLTITIDTRTGYADLDVTDAGLADDIQDGDLRIRGANTCGGIWCSVANIGFIKGYILDTLQSQLTTTLTDQISSFTCMACPEAPATCPTGTSCNADSAFCEYSDGTCVPILLGLEGQIDLGAMLASVSPGISAPVMFVDAAGDYAVADGSGYNIGVYGGLEPVTRSACIPSSYAPDPALYTPVPLATEFSTGSDFTGCRRCPTGSECSSGYTCSASGRCDDAAGACEQVTQPVMIKLGVAERYLDRVGAGLFEAGALCLSVGTSTVAQLNSTMLALLMPALDVLTWKRPAPVAIEVRPQLPPRFELGDDPLINVRLDQAQLDFYLWAYERYVRILTVQMDLTVGVNLGAEAGQLVPLITGITGANVEVTDGEIIGPPADINTLFGDLLGLVAGMIPPLSPIALPAFSGFVLQIPDGGITHVAQGTDDFLAIFANLAIAPPEPGPKSETFARLTSVTEPIADPLAAARPRLRDLLPTVIIDAASTAPVLTPRKTDYSWRLDGGSWSPWTRESRLVLRDPRFVFPGRHLVEIRSRVADDDATIDETPVQVTVDVPGLGEHVGPPPRYNRAPTARPGEALRGRQEAEPSSTGCGCVVPGRPPSSPVRLALLGLALGAVVLLRRRRALLAALAAVLFLGLAAGAGCDCGGSTGQDASHCTIDDDCPGARCCVGSGACVELPAQAGFCQPGFDCLDASGAFSPSFNPDTCEYTTDCCAELPALLPGYIGQHSEVAVDAAGTTWVSAYSAGLSDRTTYGDMVVGTWDAAAGEMDWEIIDGVPADGAVTGSPSGWRGGISTPGDDVGKYTTIAIGADGEPRVAYYDVTHGALKVARHSASGWTVSPGFVDDQGDAGRYADMAVGSDGRAAISYNAIEELTDTPGAFVSKMKVAWATDAAGTSWTVSEVESMDIPCWGDLCSDPRVCIASTRTCVTPDPEAACGTAGCDSTQACVSGSCEDVLSAPIDFPEGVGIVTGIDFDPSGNPVAVYYDRGAWDRTALQLRVHGDLKQAQWDGSAWSISVLDGSGTDAGWYPSIDIDAAGQRHVSYVDGIAETLIYLNPDAGVREVVDGRTVPGHERMIIGDDSTVRATASGQVWIAYQNAYARTLVLARRTAPGTWELQDVDTTDSSGFYANLTLGTDGETPVISTYWHRTTPSGRSFQYASSVRVFRIAP